MTPDVPAKLSRRKYPDGTLKGFSDAVFDVVAAFARGGLNPDHWAGVIEEVQL